VEPELGRTLRRDYGQQCSGSGILDFRSTRSEVLPYAPSAIGGTVAVTKEVATTVFTSVNGDTA
jgi:hypothetical protein